MTNMKTAIFTIALAGVIAGLAYQQFDTQRRLRAAQASAEQQAEEVQGLRHANELLASQTNELKRLRDEAKDVLRLRAELGQLRQEQSALKRIVAKVAQPAANDVPKEPSIQITGRFISVPTENLKDAGWAKPPNGEVELMDDQQVRAILQALDNVDGMEILSQPRVQTANGVEAALSMTQQLPLGGTNVNVGTSLRLNPHYSTNSLKITLDLAAEISRLIDTSLQQDESQGDLRVTTITNSVALSDGQSILLREDLADKGRIIGSTNGNTRPKSLLVLVTPHFVHEDGSSLRLEHIVERKEQ